MAVDQEKNTRVPGCFTIMLWLVLLIFFIFCYFLLFFLLVISCKLFFTIERGKVCYFLLLFLLLVTLINYFLLCQEGQSLYCIHCATRERVHFDFSPFFFYNC